MSKVSTATPIKAAAMRRRIDPPAERGPVIESEAQGPTPTSVFRLRLARLGRPVVRLRRRVGAVADAPHRLDYHRPPADLLAHLSLIHVHGPSVSIEGVAPHLLEQPLAREGDTPIQEEVVKKVELAGSELDPCLLYTSPSPRD